jgi:hypothetical protein
MLLVAKEDAMQRITLMLDDDLMEELDAANLARSFNGTNAGRLHRD